MSRNDYKTTRKFGIVLILLGVIWLVALIMWTKDAGANPPEPTPNQVEYWCPNGGIKFEPVSTPFVVPSAPEGRTWTLLVLKAGSGEGENETFVNPVVGQPYFRSDGKDISHAILCQSTLTTTTTTTVATTLPTTTTTATTLPTTTTTTPPSVSLFAIGTFAFCDEETNQPFISITFGNRPDLDGQTGTLFFSDFTSMSLTFDSEATVTFPYPASRTTPLLLIYVLNFEFETAVVTLPADCPLVTTTTDIADNHDNCHCSDYFSSSDNVAARWNSPAWWNSPHDTYNCCSDYSITDYCPGDYYPTYYCPTDYCSGGNDDCSACSN